MDFEKMTKEELITYINNLTEENNGKYGLVWDKEKEPEKIVVECDKKIPILKEIKKKAINNGGQNNILIEGDNFHALSVLNYTHKESIDVIYIDPPYNTGNKDFMYNDRFVDIEDGYRHSKWLNFMEKRIKLARELLNEDGVIFISIDDNEQAQLKLLCDKIFGQDNFVGSLPRVTKKSGKQHSDDISRNHDYILIYTKNYSNTIFKGIDVEEDSYIYEDEYVKERGKYKLNQTLDYNSLWYNPAMDFKIEISNEEFYPGGSRQLHYKRQKGIHNPKDWVWRWSKAKLDFGLKNDFVVIKEGKDRKRIYTKTYSKATIGKKGDLYYVEYLTRENNLSSVELVDNIYSNDNAKKELDRVMNNSKFDFPKPTSLIKKLCNIVSNKNCIVLDFFAGSGTTGQAVLELNAEDGGNRKFILCTNNENNICEDVTYPRIKTVITGKREDGSKYSDGLAGSLQYFKTDFVDNVGTKDQLYYDLTEKCIPMLCVKGDTFIPYKSTEEYIIYTNDDKSMYSCVYFDVLGQKYKEFLKEVKQIKEPKLLYIFNLGDYIDLSDLREIDNFSVESIPYKIIELYKKIVKMSKGE